MRNSTFKSMQRWFSLLCVALVSILGLEVSAQEVRKKMQPVTALSDTTVASVLRPAAAAENCELVTISAPTAKVEAQDVASLPKGRKGEAATAGLTQPQPVSIQKPAGVLPRYSPATQQDNDSGKIFNFKKAAGPAGASLTQGWETILSEDFERSFPATNSWDIRYAAAAPYFWDEVPTQAYSGSWSGWCADGRLSSYPALNAATDNYVNNMNTWMIYGPFDLSDATVTDARLDFRYWLNSEQNFDYLWWVASTTLDGDYKGYRVSGNSYGYQAQSFDLKNVPTLGNLVGQRQVYIAFVFQSDGSVTGRGAFLDDIVLQKFTRGVLPDLVADRVYLRTGPNSGAEVTNPVAGQQYYLHFNWRNTGTVAATRFRVELRFNGNVLCTGYDSVNPNTSRTSWCTGPVTWPCDSSVPISGVLDVDNAIDESNEFNNSTQKNIIVFITPPGTAELVANRIYLRTGPNSGAEVNEPAVGQQYYIHFDWRNTGPVSAKNFRSEIRLNGNAICANNAETVDCGANKTTWCASPVIWPCDGISTIEGILDVYNVIPESNESNNSARASFNKSFFTIGPPPPPCPGDLTNGVPVSNLSDVQGGQKFFKIVLPSGASSLVITTFGGSGDLDLYVRRGQSPTLSTFDCRPYIGGNNETCNFTNPLSGDWYIMLHAYSAYSGVTLRATYTTGQPCIYSLTPTSATFTANAGSGIVNVRVASGCAWTAMSNDLPWITITPGHSGNGNGTVYFTVSANPNTLQRTGSMTIAGQTFLVIQEGRSTTVFFDNVENGLNGWAPRYPWEQTTLSSFSPTHSWTDSPYGNYSDNLNVSLWSPAINLAGLASATLSFWQRYDFEPGYDYGRVWITTDNGASFTELAAFTGAQAAWTQSRINLNAYAGNASIKIVFQLRSDQYITGDGWYIDDIQISSGSSSSSATKVSDLNEPANLPTAFSLSENFPNPFNPTTAIRFTIPAKTASNSAATNFAGNSEGQATRVTLRVFNVIGQLVRTLVDEAKQPGFYTVQWDGKNDLGEKVGSGVYLYTIVAGEFKATRRMTLMK